MSFLYPHVLWALVLPLLLAAAALLRHRRAGAAWRKLVSPAHERALVTQRAPWHRLCSGICGLLALAALLVALARPINGYREAGATAASRNLLLALDISRSMETQDVKPSRLEEARAAAYELIDALPEDKIGLIVFSGDADLVVPLTYDHTALRDALEQVERNWAGTGGTDFNKVLRKAMQDFERSAPDGTNALVLLSDGEDTTDNRKDITEEAKDKHLLVITVGIGTEAGGAIPDPEGDNGLWQDADGKHVISKLDEASLRRFASATGGDYFRMTGHADLADFARRAVRKLARHEEEFSVNKVPNDLFSYAAAVALLMLIAAILCGTDWRLPRRGLPLLLALLAAGQAQGVVREAALDHYRMGSTLKGINGEEAKEHFSRALLDSDTDLQATALCGIGNTNTQATLAKLKELYTPAESPDDDPDAPAQAQGPDLGKLRGIVTELKEDITSYAEALKLRPELRPAAVNKARTEELIRMLEEEIKRQEQQQSQDEQQQNQNNEGQDDQQQNQQQDDSNDDKQDGEDKENPQDKQPNPDDKQDNPQDKNDSPDDKQGEQQNDKQDGQDKPQDDKQDQGQNKQEQEQEQQNQQNPQQQPEQQDKEEPQPEPDPADDKEKAERRAASILQMHLDEENGSPIPHADSAERPPKKDY